MVLIVLTVDNVLLATTHDSLIVILLEACHMYFTIIILTRSQLILSNYIIIQSEYGISINQPNDIKRKALKVLFWRGETIISSISIQPIPSK